MLDTVVKLQMLQERYRSETEKLFVESLKDAMEIILGKLATTTDADNIKRLNALKALIDKEVGTMYQELKPAMQSDMTEWMQLEYETLFGALSTETGLGIAFAALPKETIKQVIALDSINLVGDKAYTIDELFNNASQSQISRYKQIIAGGLASNEGTRSITKRLRDANATATTELQAITHTLIRSARSKADEIAYNDFNVTSFKSVSVLDSRTSFLCASLDGKVYDMTYDKIPNKPPRHFRCRSKIVPKSDIDSNRAQNGDNKGQISNKTTFNDWFAKQSPKFQEGYLGKARYELYKDNKLNIRDFVDIKDGSRYTIEEIKKHLQ